MNPSKRARVDRYLYGASMYPEVLPRDRWLKMLDQFAAAKMNTVRMTDSAWGHLEPASGRYAFDWLRQALDDVHARGIGAFLGTSTYIAPQWLPVKHPEVLAHFLPNQPAHPAIRKACCLNQPIYRDACCRLVDGLAAAVKDHPAVIGWQVDNEIEGVIAPCYCPACEAAWQQWLQHRFGDIDTFNRKLGLNWWGMQFPDFKSVPQPRKGIEGDHPTACLKLANMRFRRDVIIDFLGMQRERLRAADVKQSVIMDWNMVGTPIGNEPRCREIFDFSGLNYYPTFFSNTEDPRPLTFFFDLHRAAYDAGHFLNTEVCLGNWGGSQQFKPMVPHDQWWMQLMLEVAFGSSGVIYWSGNRFAAGNWPHWSGVFDWAGDQEPDFPWACELGEFFHSWGRTLLDQPVKATAALVGDFDQMSSLEVYQHTPASRDVLYQGVDVFHRIGVGVDVIPTARTTDLKQLQRYTVVMLLSAPCIDDERTTAALREYVSGGGTLIVGPFVGYTHVDGVFRDDGFASNLSPVTGCSVSNFRRLGPVGKGQGMAQPIRWNGAGIEANGAAGADGWCEILKLTGDAEAIAHFKGGLDLLEGKPAAVRRKIGKGQAIKLAFWPEDDLVCTLLTRILPGTAVLPAGVVSSPRQDGSLWIINTTDSAKPLELAAPRTDRITGTPAPVTLSPFHVLWLSPANQQG